MKTNTNMTGDTSPSAVNLLHNLKKMAEPTLQEEYLCYIHRHEIPAILLGLKYGNKIGKYVIKDNKEGVKMTESLTKICTHCGKEKILEEYQIDKRGKLGRKSICKECANAQKRETRANLKACTPQPLKKEFDAENFKKYLMYQIEVTKSMVQKLQGKIETYQELIGEL